MKGQVVEINARRGMVAVLTDAGDYSILELLGDEVEVSDQLEWQTDHPLGSESVLNRSKAKAISVFFQNHGVGKSQLRQQLLY